MSEHDWQASVLAELGIQVYGLVTPDSGAPSPNIPSAPPAMVSEGWQAPPEQAAAEPWAEPPRAGSNGSGEHRPAHARDTGGQPYAHGHDESPEAGGRIGPPSAWAPEATGGGQTPYGDGPAAGQPWSDPAGQGPPREEPVAPNLSWEVAAPQPPAEPSVDRPPPADPAPRPPQAWEPPVAGSPYLDQAAQPDQAPRPPEQGDPAAHPGWGPPAEQAPRPPEQGDSSAHPGWGPPAAQQQPPPSEEAPRQPERPDPSAQSGWGPPAAEAYRDQAPPESPYREQAARQAGQEPSEWDQASEASWSQVAQPSWGAQDDAETAAHVQPDGRQPEGRQPRAPEAWEREPGPPPEPAQPQGRHHAGPPGPPPPQAPNGPMGPGDLVRKSAHGDPLVRRVGRGVRRAVGSAAANEVRMTADVENILGRPLSSWRQIAVTSIRGGAGKTTVAGLTATVIAQYRQDRVLAVDADSGLGSLPLRLGVGTDRSLHDLAGANPRSFEEAQRFLARTTGGLWVLSGTAGGRITRELDLATFQSAVSDMSRYFSAAIVDCGAGLLPELQRGILADSHSQVMVTPGTVDGALSARGALEWQARNGYEHLLTRTVIAFVTHTPHVDSDLTRGAQMLSVGGLPVVHMPYDRHLATGSAIESARIGQETRAAAIRVAIEAFDRATSV